jgi:hypothetical protein
MKVVAPGKVLQDQKNAGIRKLDLDSNLLSILEELAVELKVGILVRSGGQMAKAEAIRKKADVRTNKDGIDIYSIDGVDVRIGSTRHDSGKAADIVIYHPEIGTLKNNAVNDNNPNDDEKKLLQKFIARGKKKGLKGIGTGAKYMDGGGSLFSTMHVDIARDGKWGGLASWWTDAYTNPDNYMDEDDESVESDDVETDKSESGGYYDEERDIFVPTESNVSQTTLPSLPLFNLDFKQSGTEVAFDVSSLSSVGGLMSLLSSGPNIGRMMEFGEASPRERASMIVEFETMIQQFGIPTEVLDLKFNEIPLYGNKFPDVSLREALSDPEARERLVSSEGANAIRPLKTFLTSKSKEEQVNAINDIKKILDNFGMDTSSFEYLTKPGFPQEIIDFVATTAKEQGVELDPNTMKFLEGVEPSVKERSISEGSDVDREEAIKEITTIVKKDVLGSNPLLQQIMNLFDNNKGLFTLLGGAVGISGLTGILGGGMLGGFAAGAGGIAAARLALGPEGFAELQNTIQGAAAPVFDIFSEFVAEGTPLGDLPVIGNILRGTVGVGRENPLAAIALASGNIGAAAGLVAGQTGIGVLDGTVNPEDLAQNLSSTFGDVTRVLDALGIAQAGASSDGGGRAITTGEQTAQARNNYSRGNPGQSASIDELFNYQDTSLTNDFGYSGNGVQALA